MKVSRRFFIYELSTIPVIPVTTEGNLRNFDQNKSSDIFLLADHVIPPQKSKAPRLSQGALLQVLTVLQH